jgi:NADH dehydrogenase
MVLRALPKVFIVGGGFAGLEAAKALAQAPAEVTLVDRRNHHVFQPLLYQVATASLSPADISAPIRTVLRGQRNCQIALAEVSAINVDSRHLIFSNGHAEYDYLILAAGATHAYFGHEEWAAIAPGLKSLEDAIELRRRILLAFETAEYEGSEAARRAVLTFGIVGRRADWSRACRGYKGNRRPDSAARLSAHRHTHHAGNPG